MLFGDHLEAAASPDAGAWIEPARRGRPGTVGDLVPGGYEAFVRVHPPAPHDGDWWASYRDVFTIAVVTGARHTATPDRVWFAVWEGHGYDRFSSRLAVRGPLDDDARRAVEAARRALAEEDAHRTVTVRAALSRLARVELPHRTYYVLQGPAAAIGGFTYPGEDGWRNPDLVWPDAREWFVATDVDIWSLYVGGSAAFVDEVAERSPTRVDRVDVDTPLVPED